MLEIVTDDLQVLITEHGVRQMYPKGYFEYKVVKNSIIFYHERLGDCPCPLYKASIENVSVNGQELTNDNYITLLENLN